MCLDRLLIVSFLALFCFPKNGDHTSASTVNHVVKNGTTSEKLQQEIINNIPLFHRQRLNPRVHNSPKSQDATTEEPSVKNGTTSTKLQREILNLLGLPRRPRLSLNTRLHGRKMSAPRYMMDLYNTLQMNVTSSNRGFCCNETGTDVSRAESADTIMSYLNHGKSVSVAS